MPSSSTVRQKQENIVGELQEQTLREEEGVNVNMNKPCVTPREGIYFSMRLELSLGI